MRKLALILSVLGLVTFVNAQSLTGPKYKNTKAWEKPASTNQLVSDKSTELSKGPKVKNGKAWENNTEKQAISTESQAKITGPKAKNQKH